MTTLETGLGGQPPRRPINMSINRAVGTGQEQKDSELREFIDDVATGAALELVKKKFGNKPLIEYAFLSQQAFLVKPQLVKLLQEGNNFFAKSLLEAQDRPGVRTTHQNAIARFVKYAESRVKWEGEQKAMNQREYPINDGFIKDVLDRLGPEDSAPSN